MAPVDMRRAYFTLQHKEEYSSNCRQKVTGQVMHTCGHCCTAACTATKLGGRDCIDTQRSQVDERVGVPMRVARLHQGRRIGEGADLEKNGKY